MPYETPEERDDREAAERRHAAQAYWSKKEAQVVKSRDVDNKDVVNSEELIRGMAEMAERYTARMNTAGEQIDELRECLILAVKDLELGPPVSVYTKFICVRARKALGLTADDRIRQDEHNAIISSRP